MKNRLNFFYSLFFFSLLLLQACGGGEKNEGQVYMETYFENLKNNRYTEAFEQYDERFWQTGGKEKFLKIHKETYQKLGAFENAELTQFMSQRLEEEGKPGDYYVLHYTINYGSEKGVEETFNVYKAKADGQFKILNRRINNSKLLPKDPFLLDFQF